MPAQRGRDLLLKLDGEGSGLMTTVAGLRSHTLAAKGTADGRLTAEIVPWLSTKPGEAVVQQDNGIRTDTSLEQMAKLKPVFDRRYGTVTAANASPLTDGASAVLLMSAEAARALGYEPLTFIRSYAVAAVDPGLEADLGKRKEARRAVIQFLEPGAVPVPSADHQGGVGLAHASSVS